MSHYLKHDTALDLAVQITAELSQWVPESERQRLTGRLYEVLLAALRNFEERHAREMQRLARPTKSTGS